MNVKKLDKVYDHFNMHKKLKGGSYGLPEETFTSSGGQSYVIHCTETNDVINVSF